MSSLYGKHLLSVGNASLHFSMISLWKTVYLYGILFFFSQTCILWRMFCLAVVSACLWMLGLLSTLSCTIGPKLADMNGIFFCFRADCFNEPFIGPSPKYWQTQALLPEVGCCHRFCKYTNMLGKDREES